MMGLQLRPAMAPALDSSNSNMADVTPNERWSQLAGELWLSSSSARETRPDTIKSRIWDPLESDRFDPRSLSLLENLQILERYAKGDGNRAKLLTDYEQDICGLLLPKMRQISWLYFLRPLWVLSSEHIFRYGVSKPQVYIQPIILLTCSRYLRGSGRTILCIIPSSPLTESGQYASPPRKVVTTLLHFRRISVIREADYPQRIGTFGLSLDMEQSSLGRGSRKVARSKSGC